MNEHVNPVIEERERALRRYNWLFLYIPVAVLGLVVLGVTILMLILTFQEENRASTRFISAVADTVIIIASCNFALLGAIILGVAAVMVREKRQRKISLSRTTTNVLRRLDSAILQVNSRTVGASHRVKGIAVKSGGLAAFFFEIFKLLPGKILRR